MSDTYDATYNAVRDHLRNSMVHDDLMEMVRQAVGDRLPRGIDLSEVIEEGVRTACAAKFGDFLEEHKDEVIEAIAKLTKQDRA